MTNRSLLGGERAARVAAGKDVDALGPSDSSDSGSDVQGEHSLQGEGEHADQLGALIVGTANDSDASGTGERGSATGKDIPAGADIMPDHVIDPRGESDVSDVSDDSDDSDDSREESALSAEFGDLLAAERDPLDAPGKT